VLSWCEVITHGRQFDESRDTPRFHAAFAMLGARREWPTPADFLEALPAIPKQSYRMRLEDESARERTLRQLEEFAATMRVSAPEKVKYKVPNLEPNDFPRCCEKGTKEQPVCDECKAEMEALHGPVRKFDNWEGVV
jgi:hypothetical protein